MNNLRMHQGCRRNRPGFINMNGMAQENQPELGQGGNRLHRRRQEQQFNGEACHNQRRRRCNQHQR